MTNGEASGERAGREARPWTDVALAAAGIGPVARLRAALETLVDPHVLLLAVRGAAGRIEDFEFVDANTAACTYAGTTYDDLVGSRLTAYDEWSDAEILAAFADVVDAGGTLVLDGHAVVVDGRTRRSDLRAVDLGEAVSVTWRDVTGRHEQASRFEALADVVADVVLFTRDGVIEWVSRSVTEVLGWTPEECVGRPGDFVVHRDDRHLLGETRRARRGGRSARVRMRHLRKDGGVVWCEARARSVVAGDGAVDGAVVSIRDVSEQVEAEQEREAAEARYRLVAEHASDVVYVVDPDGDFAWVSPSVEGVLGWRPEDLVGSPVSRIVAGGHPTAPVDPRSLASGEDHAHEPVEVRFRTAAGPRLWMSLRADPVVGADGTVTAAVCSLRLCQDEVVERWAAATLSAGNALVAEATDEQDLLTRMCGTAVREGGYRFAWYGRVAGTSGSPVVPVAAGRAGHGCCDHPDASWTDGPRGQVAAGRAVRTGETAIERGHGTGVGSGAGRARGPDGGFASSISLPVRVDGVVDGALSVFAEEPDASGPRAVALLEDLALSLGLGIERLRGRRDLEVAFGNSIDLIASVVESRDPCTAGHQARVAELASAIGRELGLDEHRIEGLAYAAAIHDMGKVGVPIDLLSRPGRLSDEELALIRRHATIGWEITSRLDWPWPIADIIHQHHERMDGSGYPLGLRGGEILLESRIVAVADVYDAVSSRRPYREALGGDTARALVVEGSGASFDADVVAAFLRVLDGGFAFAGITRSDAGR